MKMEKMNRYLQLFRKAGVLKETDREGWKRVGIDDPESVADHSFRAAFMAMTLGEEFGLDGFKLVKLLMVHDLAESEIGDITPDEPISEDEKFRKEKESIERISSDLDGVLDLESLWKEYETGETREAEIARDIDRLERILQAQEYEEEYPEKDLSEFLIEGRGSLESEEIKDLLTKLSS